MEAPLRIVLKSKLFAPRERQFWKAAMSAERQFDLLIIGSGEAGKNLAWTMARAGRRTAVVERMLIGGSCPNIACLPSKNVIHSAKVAELARRGPEFGVMMESLTIEMARVRARKRQMVDGEIRLHLELYKASGAELIMGEARFVAPKTVEVRLKGAARGCLRAIRSFWILGPTRPFPMCQVSKPPSR
jgi:pyruvate/2-oxoglutarate dehydrogenase complex dihydrolipoamide dehydrogenase (E3) component